MSYVCVTWDPPPSPPCCCCVPIHVHVIQGSILSAIASRDPQVLKTPTPRLASEMVSGAIKFWEGGHSLVWLER